MTWPSARVGILVQRGSKVRLLGFAAANGKGVLLAVSSEADSLE